MFNPVRGGNRGGRDQFKWEDIRTLPYKERECYLGSTVTIGFLDKGGKWRKKDWWIRGVDGSGSQSEELMREIKKNQMDDRRRINIALGIESEKVDDIPKLNEYEISELTKKTPKTTEGYQEEEDYKEEKMHGLGYNINETKLKFSLAAPNTDYNRLEGEGINTKKEKFGLSDKSKNIKKENKDRDRKEEKKAKKEMKKLKKEMKKEQKKEKKKEKEKKKHHSEKKEEAHRSRNYITV